MTSFNHSARVDRLTHCGKMTKIVLLLLLLLLLKIDDFDLVVMLTCGFNKTINDTYIHNWPLQPFSQDYGLVTINNAINLLCGNLVILHFETLIAKVM